MIEMRTRSRDVSEQHARWILAALIAASALGFSYLAWLKYSCFNWETSDTALYSYAFHQTLKGKFFPLFVHEGSLLGNHPNFLLLLWLPVYWAVPTTYSLLLFQSLMISLAAWPIYLVTRLKTKDRLTALVASAGFLLFPPIVGQHVNQIHDDQFGLALLLFAFYYFEVGNFPRFTVFLALSLLAKETMALYVGAFGLYALAIRRDRKWVVLPILLGIAYLIFTLGFLMPRLGVEVTRLYRQPAYFAGYGNSPAEIAKFISTHPAGVVATMFGPDRIGYLMRLLLPLAIVLPFGSRAWIVAAPMLVLNLLGTNRLMRDLTWHYSLIAAGVLWTSFLVALPKWTRIFGRRFGTRNCGRLLCLTVLVLCISLCPLWLSPWQYRPSANHQARVEAIAAVPINASVLSPENMLAHFARHPAIHSLAEMRYYHCDPNQVFDYDYIVFDASYPSPDWQGQSQLFALISARPEYRSVFSRDNVFVFQRIGTPPRALHW
jgi:uncharacterized membrane protein